MPVSEESRRFALVYNVRQPLKHACTTLSMQPAIQRTLLGPRPSAVKHQGPHVPLLRGDYTTALSRDSQTSRSQFACHVPSLRCCTLDAFVQVDHCVLSVHADRLTSICAAIPRYVKAPEPLQLRPHSGSIILARSDDVPCTLDNDLLRLAPVKRLQWQAGRPRRFLRANGQALRRMSASLDGEYATNGVPTCGTRREVSRMALRRTPVIGQTRKRCSIPTASGTRR
ncbi:hypothetical protein FKP32DRAFT_649117 [Trametes sanguinea]|nr:hypothetical protein FKP32DRAFT_649117 [Trametes sanguinea]